MSNQPSLVEARHQIGRAVRWLAADSLCGAREALKVLRNLVGA